MPSTLGQTLKRGIKCTAMFVLHFACSDLFPFKYCYTPQFAHHSLSYKVFYSLFASLGVRSQYYAVWTLSEGWHCYYFILLFLWSLIIV